METAVLERNALGQDKVSRYGWTVGSVPGDFKDIPKRLLKINREEYQRDGIPSKVLEFASNWSWIACGALIVAERDGEYWVVDGQHRKLAADRRSDIYTLPCMVFQTDGVKQDAQAFLDTNTNRRNVTALAKFKARLATGDELAQAVQMIIAQSGLRLATASKEAGDFKAIALALSIAERDQDGLRHVLQLSGEMAFDERAPVHQRIVQGLYYIHRHFDLRTQRLRERIKAIGLEALLRGADKAAAYYGAAGEKIIADGMLQVINHGLRNRFDVSQPVSNA